MCVFNSQFTDSLNIFLINENEFQSLEVGCFFSGSIANAHGFNAKSIDTEAINAKIVYTEMKTNRKKKIKHNTQFYMTKVISRLIRDIMVIRMERIDTKYKMVSRIQRNEKKNKIKKQRKVN